MNNFSKILEASALIALKQFKQIPHIEGIKKLDKKHQSAFYECILQSYLFCGFPAALEAMKQFKLLYPEYKSASNKNSLAQIKNKGKIICKKVYGRSYDKLIRNITGLSPELNEWMLTEGYGKVLGRSSLSVKQREMINVVLLSITNYPVQLLSHIKGMLNNKASESDINQVMSVLKKYSQSGIKRYQKVLCKTINS